MRGVVAYLTEIVDLDGCMCLLKVGSFVGTELSTTHL